MLKKEQLHIPLSNFYIRFPFKEEPIRHLVTDDDLYDPGKLAFKYNFPFSYWSIILRYNGIVDPINDIEVGMILYIPSAKELKNLELSL
jgi:hypothetical protein